MGFYVRETANYIYVLGGNQSDAVTIAPVPKARLIGYRWPIIPDPVPAHTDDRLFNHFIGLVIDLEGGWSEDETDPGGPTNRGILLTEYAAYKGKRINSTTYEMLRAGLRNITDKECRDIYWKDYWSQIDAEHLPDGLAIFTFDTAVLQGVGTAKRMLQQAVGAEVDGIIGPKTRGAAVAVDEMTALRKFRDIRMAYLRKLKGWRVYGDGWTNRVSAMFDEASGHATRPTVIEGTAETTPKPEVKTVADETAPKSWSNSLTIWGAIVTFLASVMPAVGQLIGIDISADLVHTFGDAVAHLIEALGGVIGTLMVVYGRFRATQPLTTATTAK